MKCDILLLVYRVVLDLCRSIWGDENESPCFSYLIPRAFGYVASEIDLEAGTWQRH